MPIAWSSLVVTGSLISIILIYLPFWNSHASEFTSLNTFGQQWYFNPLVFRLIEKIYFIQNSRLVAALCVVTGLLVITARWILTYQKPDNSASHYGFPPLDIAFLVLLLFSPVVNSWYWLWVLPLAIMQQRLWLIIFCCGGVLAYINGTVFYDSAWFSQFFSPGLFEVPIIKRGNNCCNSKIFIHFPLRFYLG